MKKFILIFALAVLVVAPLAVAPAQAAVNVGEQYPGNIGFGNEDPRDIAANLIQVGLTFLGILATIIILVGGFKWMTAQGNEDQVAEAKKIIIAGIVGLIVIFASWGIATFVLNTARSVTNS